MHDEVKKILEFLKFTLHAHEKREHDNVYILYYFNFNNKWYYVSYFISSKMYYFVDNDEDIHIKPKNSSISNQILTTSDDNLLINELRKVFKSIFRKHKISKL